MSARTSLAGVAAAALAFTALAPAIDAQRQVRERTIIVSVVSNDDKPVKGLAAGDFIVRENGLAREVVRVEPAQPPSHVALLVDDSQATRDAVQYLRSSLSAFAKAVAVKGSGTLISFTTFGERPTRRANFTADTAAIEKEVTRLFPVTNSGAYFLEAIGETVRDLRQRSAERPVIVAFVDEDGPEFSNALEGQVAEALKSIGASLWTITLQTGPQQLATTEARERARVLSDVTTESGGANHVLLTPQGLDTAFADLAAQLTSRYAVTYGRPESLIPPDRTDVEVRRAGLRVRASHWAAAK